MGKAFKLNLTTPNSTVTHTANSSLTSAVTLSNDLAGGIVIQATGTNIRYTLDGTTPTATLGWVLYAGEDMTYIDLTPGMVLKFIEESATATLQYMFVVGQ